jgi:hypothetical protein
MPLRTRLAASILATLPLMYGGGAAAAPTPDSAHADQLFREGKAALEAKRYAEACPKLAESQALDPGTGTLLALALCHEGLGSTATAWREFLDVAAASQKGRTDRAALAADHAHALEPQLSKVRLEVPSELQPKVQVRVDGNEVASATWMNPMPLDPGDHVIEALVQDALPFKQAVHLGPHADLQTVSVPSPETVVAAPKAPPAAPMTTRHKMGWGLGGAGAVVFITGVVLGIEALSEHGSATSLCSSSPCSNATGVSDESTAKSLAWGADFAVPIGLAGLATGIYFLATKDPTDKPPAEAPPSDAPTARVTPTFGPGSAGLAITGTF